MPRQPAIPTRLHALLLMLALASAVGATAGCVEAEAPARDERRIGDGGAGAADGEERDVDIPLIDSGGLDDETRDVAVDDSTTVREDARDGVPHDTPADGASDADDEDGRADVDDAESEVDAVDARSEDARRDAETGEDAPSDGGDVDDTADGGADAAEPCRTDEDCDDDDECTFDECLSGRCLHSIRDRDGDFSLDGFCGGQDCDDENRDVYHGSRRPCASACGATGFETCRDAEWTACSAPEVCECEPGAVREESCGRCGVTTRTCGEDGRWGRASDCTGEGGCFPGDVTVERCGEIECGGRTESGIRSVVCTDECVWEPEECRDAPACCPGASRDVSCGPCPGDTVTERCDADFTWIREGECGEPTECCPGAAETIECGRCGALERTCAPDGTWDEGPCESPTCCPGDTDDKPCGTCIAGVEERVCSDDGEWGEFGPCSADDLCCPGEERKEPCGTCGEATLTCGDAGTWSEPSACVEPDCCDGASEVEPCEECGRRRRVCEDGIWSDWTECLRPDECR